MVCIRETNTQRGIALIGAMVLVLILSLLGSTILNLAGQEAVSSNVGREAVIAQQLADAAGEVVVSWFHSPQAKSAGSAFSTALAKRNYDAEGILSFFDQAGRSQFVGTMGQPDVLVETGAVSDNQVLNDPRMGMFYALRHLGRIEALKVYAPSTPGLLCTVDVRVATHTNPPFQQSVLMQLGTVDLPPLRAAVQVSQSLGIFQSGNEALVSVHWGDLKVGGDFVVGRAEELPAQSRLVPITGLGYDEMFHREDRWMDAWVGGDVRMTQLPTGAQPALTQNIHPQQIPTPGMQFDRWHYEATKRIAQRHGRYFAIDQDGFLHQDGVVNPGHGITPDAVFQSKIPGNHRGLIFIDTLDQTAPREDNLGTLRLHTAYWEGHLVMQGHVVVAPIGSGQSISVLSPPDTDHAADQVRTPVQLSHMHFNGVLSAAGNITVAGSARVYGAVMTGGTILSSAGGTLEVWYDHDLSQGLYRGIPLVYRAPGAWVAQY
ncbi:MAG: hypothetical protein HP494_10460 [Nitrospira sp.]|nr:hypothetical protein [Nitrospira sp.]